VENPSSHTFFFSGFPNNYSNQKFYFACPKLIFNFSFLNSCFNSNGVGLGSHDKGRDRGIGRKPKT
jgi:hypothetical protein